MRFYKYLAGFGLALALVACGGGGGSAGSQPGAGSGTPVNTTNATVSSIGINPSSTVLNADGTSTITLSVHALTAGNASVSGATIDVAATNGVVLSTPTLVTTATGATVTLTASSSDQTNRIATVTASCVGCSAVPATTQITVVGGSITLANLGSNSVVVGGTNSTLTATVKNFSGVAMSGVDVTFAATDPLVLGLSATTAKTNGAGVAQVVVSGLKAGLASVNVSALGNAQSQAFTSGAATALLAITSPASRSVVVLNTPQTIVVSAPSASTSVTFATTVGTFSNGQRSQIVAVVGGAASAVLTSSQAGTAAVTVFDSSSNSANLVLTVSPPVSAANKILLNANQTTIPLSVAGGVQNSLTLTARASSFDGSKDQFVANVPIQFSMTGGPSAGEFLTPALVYTDSSGAAQATFTSGTSASISNGIIVNAAILGTSVKTGISPSSNDALLTVGGQALSVAFGPASVLGESTDKTLYVHAYSVQVTDANNNPVANQLVTLRLRPVAFSLGTPCNVTATYCSEDVNGNGSLDIGEDGTRTATTYDTAGTCPATAPIATGSLDTNLTPSNSDGGGVPATVTTNANGTASFNLTYLKGSAFWIVDKLTATVSSNGTEASKSSIFQLPAIKSESTLPDACFLPASPYGF